MIGFEEPWFLAGGAVALAFAIYRAVILKSPRKGMRRRLIQGCWILSCTCACFALAGITFGHELDRLAVVVAYDHSRSTDPDPRASGSDGFGELSESYRRAAEEMRSDDIAGLVVFGSVAATEVLPASVPRFGSERAPVPREGTDIGAGIRRALADLPSGYTGRIVLVTDGVQNAGDALSATTSAARRGVVVDVVPVERSALPEVAVEQVRLPARAEPGQPIELRIVTRATQETPVRVTVSRGGQPVAMAETTVAAGTDALVMRDEAPDAGVHQYEVHIEALQASQDRSEENNRGGAFLRVAGVSRALVLSKQVGEVTGLVSALESAGLVVDVGDHTRVPVDMADLASYDLLVLDNLPARAMAESQLRMIQSYVRDLGGGLLMSGTRDAFGLGGYAYTPIEAALPATFDLRQRQDRASLSMMIAIDNSGSMGAMVGGGRTKLDLANEAAARSAQLLSPMDRAGVIHVDTAVHWTLPLSPVEDPERVAQAIRAATPGGGGIYVGIALDASFGALREEQTQLKHLILFSDGSDSVQMENARSQVTSALRENITTSVVSMGAGHDTPELEVLARLGEGRFYIVEDLTELPRIFTQETIEASRSAIIEGNFQASLGDPGEPTQGIDFSSAPALGGYVAMNARARATRMLMAEDGDPLLTHWQYGIGRSATFASDTGSTFGRDWLSWSGYAALFGQLARNLARSPERSDARVSVSIDGDVGRVRVEAVDEEGRYQNYLELTGNVAAPGGRPVDLNLEQTGAGRYEGTFDASAAGAYLVTVGENEGGLVGSAGVVRARGDELRGEGTNHALIAQIASLSGGSVRADLTGIFEERPAPVYAHESLWPLFLLASVLLLFFSVVLRKFVFPPLPAFLRSSAAKKTARKPSYSLQNLAAKKVEKRAAPEIEAAQRTQGNEGPPAASREAPTERGPAPPAPKAAPRVSSLAEKLLERKKKGR